MKKKNSFLAAFQQKRRQTIREEVNTAIQAALDSTAINRRTSDYYRDATNESASEVFDANTRQLAQARGLLEYLNDPLFYGACQKIASLVCGAGAALKVEGPVRGYAGADVTDRGEKAQYLERAFKRFADAIDLLGMLRLIQAELLFHGEVFVRKIRSASTVEGYKYVFIRPDRVLDPPGVGTDPLVNDGILYDSDDDAAEPVGYYVQKEKINPLRQTIEYELLPAGEIIHIFNRILP